MIFVIQYNRRRGRILYFMPYVDSERERAERLRLEIELDLNRKGLDDEVVLLEAASSEALRKTHRRYFEDAQAIVESTEETGKQ